MDKCIECENETMLKYSSLYCDYEYLQERLKLTESCMIAVTNMANYLAKKCSTLENLVKLYKEKAESE